MWKSFQREVSKGTCGEGQGRDERPSGMVSGKAGGTEMKLSGGALEGLL